MTHDVTVYSIAESKPGTPGAITGSTDICQGSTQFYSIAPVPTANSYTWSTTGGFIIVSGQGTTTVEVSAPIGVTSGDIRVRANICKGSSSDRSKNIKGKTLPAPPNSIQGPTTVCTNKSISYKIQGTSSGTTYVWDITGLTAIVNNLNENKEAKITFLAPGTALVKTYSINVCGLAGPTTKTVTVNNCNRMIDDAANAAQISVYPNPAKDLLNLKFQSEQNQTFMIRLMDMTGRIVYFESNSAVEGENKTEINLSGFASGIYMLNLQSNESNQQIRVMVE